MSNRKHTAPITRIDNSAMKNIIDKIDEIDYTDTVITLSANLVGIDKKYYDSATYGDFCEYIIRIAKGMMSRDQLNAIKILLKHKKNALGNFVLNNSVPLNMQPQFTLNCYTNEVETFNPTTKPLNCNEDEMRKKRMIDMYNNSVMDGFFING